MADPLAPARGIWAGVLLGAAIWLLAAGLIWWLCWLF